MDRPQSDIKLKFGLYQLRVSIIVILTSFVLPVIILIMPMMQRRPEFIFKTADIGAATVVDREEFCRSTYYSVPFEELYDNIDIDYSNIDNWAADLKLVCNTKLIFSLVSTVYFIGSIASNYGLSKVPDTYGRRKIFIILNIITAIATTQLCFLFHIAQIIISSFMLGLASLNMSVGSIILNETLESEHSGLAMGIANSMFPLAGLLNTVLVFYFSSWKVFYFMVCGLSVLCCYLSVKYLKETTKWLQDNGKYSNYVRTIKYIVKQNDDPYEKRMIVHMLEQKFGIAPDIEKESHFGESDSEKEKADEARDIMHSEMLEKRVSDLNVSFENRTSYEIEDLFIYKSLRSLSLINLYLWVVTGFSFYGLLLNLENLTGNIFIDSIVSYSGELLAEIISGYLANIYGNKVVIYSMAMSSLTCFGFSFFDTMALKIPLLFLASIGISSSFNVLYIFTPQYYPTNIRALSVSFFSLTNRVAAGFVPIFLNLFDNLILGIGILSAVASLFVQFLPEVLEYHSGSEVQEKEIKRTLSNKRKFTGGSANHKIFE